MTGRGVSTGFRPKPIALSWLLAVGVDLFFNAGVFSGLFDQSREPSLLSDEVLFRRIPFAYLALAVGVTGLAWLIDRLDAKGSLTGAVVGGLVGAAFALMGTVSLWTALEMTGTFVGSAVLVQVIQFGTAGAFLAGYRARTETRGLVWGAIALTLLLATAGVVAQNLLSG